MTVWVSIHNKPYLIKCIITKLICDPSQLFWGIRASHEAVAILTGIRKQYKNEPAFSTEGCSVGHNRKVIIYFGIQQKAIKLWIYWDAKLPLLSHHIALPQEQGLSSKRTSPGTLLPFKAFPGPWLGVCDWFSLPFPLLSVLRFNLRTCPWTRAVSSGDQPLEVTLGEGTQVITAETAIALDCPTALLIVLSRGSNLPLCSE